MDLWSFRTMMRTSISVVTIPLPGNSEWRAAKAHRHIHALIADAMNDPLTDARTDLLANLLRARDEQGLTPDEIASHVIFVIAASYRRAVVGHDLDDLRARPQPRMAGPRA